MATFFLEVAFSFRRLSFWSEHRARAKQIFRDDFAVEVLAEVDASLKKKIDLSNFF